MRTSAKPGEASCQPLLLAGPAPDRGDSGGGAPAMRIVLLQDCPALVAPIAQWHHAEWHALYPQKTVADFERELCAPPRDNGLPQTWLLLDGNQVVGTASLLEHDMATNTDLSPWLANIYIRPDRRGGGLGRQLVRRVMQKAKGHGIGTLYLFTSDQQAFYERLGWRLLKVEPYEGIAVAIMMLTLPGTAGLVPAAPGL